MNLIPEFENTLNCIQEECAEIIQAISKIKRFGWCDSHFKTGNTENWILLAREYGDLKGCFDKLEQFMEYQESQYFFHIVNMEQEEKPSKIDKYWKYTQELNNGKT